MRANGCPITRVLLTLFCFTLPITNVQACETISPLSSTTLVLAIEDSWPPYADRQGQGISRTLVEEALALFCIQADFKVMPYARVLREVENGDLIGGMNVTRQASTEEKFTFGKHPILQAKASFYTLEPPLQPVTTIEQVADGSRIGLIIDYEYGDRYEQQRHRFSELRVDSQEQLIQLLLRGRIDATIMFDQVARYTLENAGQDPNLLFRNFQNHQSDIYVAFTRQFKQDEQLIKTLADLLDQGVVQLKRSGRYREIISGQ